MRKPRPLWDDYQECLAEARGIATRAIETRPAYSSGVCKNCVWYSACIKALEAADDLTLIPGLGRSKRDVMIDRIGSIREFAEINPAGFVAGKKTVFPGIGPDTLEKFHARARLLATKEGKPYLREPITLPVTERELFFDIEVDPMRDVCYLHGFVERKAATTPTSSSPRSSRMNPRRQQRKARSR